MEPSDCAATDAGVTAAAVDIHPASRGRRRRRRFIVAAVVGGFVIALVVAGLLSADSKTISSENPRRGGMAPAFRLPSLRDPATVVSLADFRGRPVVVNFWASWCVPCRQEMPAFQAVYRQVKGRIDFVGINHQDARDDALAFVRETGVRYPIGFDPDGTTARAYGLFGVPTTVFIDARGRELKRHTGQLSQADLRGTLDRLFPREKRREE